MTSQDDLTLLREMYRRGEIDHEQYDVLRRHVMWGTPLPQVTEELRGAPLADYPTSPGWSPPADHPAGSPGAAAPGPAPPAGLLPAFPLADAPERTRARRDEPRTAARRSRGSERPPADTDLTNPTAAARPSGRPAGGVPSGNGVTGPATGPRPSGRVAAGVATHNGKKAPAGTGRASGRRPPGESPGNGGIGPTTGARASRRTATAAPAVPDAPARKGRKRRAPHLLAALTSLALALALVAAGVWWLALRETGVNAPTYARAICSGVRDWQQAVDASSDKLVRSIGQQDDREAVRRQVSTYYSALATETDELRAAVVGAGVVDVPDGRAYGESFAAAIGEEASTLRELAGRAGRLDTRSPTVFEISVQSLLTDAQTAVSNVAAALARPPAGTPAELRLALSAEPACAPYVG